MRPQRPETGCGHRLTSARDCLAALSLSKPIPLVTTQLVQTDLNVRVAIRIAAWHEVRLGLEVCRLRRSPLALLHADSRICTEHIKAGGAAHVCALFSTGTAPLPIPYTTDRFCGSARRIESHRYRAGALGRRASPRDQDALLVTARCYLEYSDRLCWRLR